MRLAVLISLVAYIQVAMLAQLPTTSSASTTAKSDPHKFERLSLEMQDLPDIEVQYKHNLLRDQQICLESLDRSEQSTKDITNYKSQILHGVRDISLPKLIRRALNRRISADKTAKKFCY